MTFGRHAGVSAAKLAHLPLARAAPQTARIVGVAELVRREPATHAGAVGKAVQLDKRQHLTRLVHGSDHR